VQHNRDTGPRDNPVVMFSNSLGTDLRIWDGVAAGLAKNFHLVLYDKREHGLSDAPTPPQLDRDLANLIPGARFALIEESGHLPCIERPERVAACLQDFFREVQIV